MTTWMTPVGVVLIIGGIATLIVFRKALFGSSRGNDGGVRGHGAAGTGKRGNSRRADVAGRRRGRSAQGGRDGAATGRRAAPPEQDGAGAVAGTGRDGMSGRDGLGGRDGVVAGPESVGSGRDAGAAGRDVVAAGRDSAAAGRDGAAARHDGAGARSDNAARREGAAAREEISLRSATPAMAPADARRGRRSAAVHQEDPARRPATEERPKRRSAGQEDAAEAPVAPAARSGRRSATAERERTGPGHRSAEPERDAVSVPEPRASRRFWPIAPATDADPDAPASPTLTESAPTDDDDHPGPGTRVGLRRFRPADDEVDSAPAHTPGPTDVHLVSLGATADLDVTPDLERHGDGEDAESDPDGDAEGREAYGLAALGLADDDEWLGDEDVRQADPLSREQADIEEPDLSGDFEAVQDTDASGSFPAALDPFAVGGYDVDPFEGETGDVPGRSDRRYGDRVEGWVRPQYRDEPASGDYWTPVPDAGYGWPVPVERIPAVPPYPPASGFDPVPEVESEPTAVVRQWPPARPDDRVGAPRSWARDDADSEGAEPRGYGTGDRWAADDENSAPEDRNAPYRSRRDRARSVTATAPESGAEVPEPETGYAGRPESAEGPIWTVPDLPDAPLPDLAWTRSTADEEESRRFRRSSIPVRRRRGGSGDSTQHLPAVEVSQARPRPRPRPRPATGQPDARSTVYVSKHAAEPS